MLKIRDNVDLKELEKYEFGKDTWGRYSKMICIGRRGQCFELIVNDDRVLLGYSVGADGDGEESEIDNTLYDLIKADLVERVEDE